MAPALRFCLGVVALFLGAASAQADETDHGDHDHHLVRITDGKLTPRETLMSSGEAIAWANYSAKAALITFDREVGKHIVCQKPGSFRLTDMHLESSRLRPRQFASLCRLQPGRYRYRVELFGTPGALDDDPALEGTIVVEP